MIKRVNVRTNTEIRNIPTPIYSNKQNIAMNTKDIRTCIMKGAYVYEILNDGSTLRLDLNNYNKENNKPVVGNYNKKEEKVVAPNNNEMPIIKATPVVEPAPVVEEVAPVVEEKAEEPAPVVEEVAPVVEEKVEEVAPEVVEEEAPVEEEVEEAAETVKATEPTAKVNTTNKKKKK